jgi:RNA ligase (TIGR02306 family)
MFNKRKKMPEATVEVIESLRKHPNADTLELATVLGFQCIVPLNKYKTNEKIIYIRPDSVLPKDQTWAAPFLKYAPTRVKAMKLRGEWSEGIVLGFDALAQVSDYEVGTDISQQLNVTHYEVPESGEGASPGTRAQLPHQIPKTDEDRWEAIKSKIPYGSKADVTLKVDGQSWSAYYHLATKEFGVLGRKLAYDPEVANNDYTAHVKRYDIKTKLSEYCEQNQVSLCIRGESYGTGIQKLSHNPHSKLPKGLFLFSTYLIDKHCYADKDSPHYFVKLAKELGIPHVPIVEEDVLLTAELVSKYSKMENLNNQPFEGVVINTKDSNNQYFSFKVINKNYDSKK